MNPKTLVVYESIK